jgi:hypothetical protein
METTMTTGTAQNLVETIRNATDAKPTPSNTGEVGEPCMKWTGVPLHRAVFEGENRMEVVVGTNAPMGGDAEHGGQTVLMLHDLGNTQIQTVRVMVKEQGGVEPCGLLFVVGGDSEARTLADALEYAAKVIKSQIKANFRGES